MNDVINDSSPAVPNFFAPRTGLITHNIFMDRPFNKVLYVSHILLIFVKESYLCTYI